MLACALLWADGATAATVRATTATEEPSCHGVPPRSVDRIAVSGDAADEALTIAVSATAVTVSGTRRGLAVTGPGATPAAVRSRCERRCAPRRRRSARPAAADPDRRFPGAPAG